MDKGSLVIRAALRIVAPYLTASTAMLKRARARIKLRRILRFEIAMLRRVFRGSARCANRYGRSRVRIAGKILCILRCHHEMAPFLGVAGTEDGGDSVCIYVAGKWDCNT